jgi:curved DNA-binding protein CbpA
MQADFDLLEIDPSAGIGEIKKAYREKAKLFHPDRNKAPEAAEKFRLYTEAYERLIDLKEGRTFVFSTTKTYEEEIREKARQQSLKKYQEWQQHLKAYERLSIHKIFWGRKAASIMICFCLLIIADDRMTGNLIPETIQHGVILDTEQQNYILIKTETRTFEGASEKHDLTLSEGMPIIIHETPLFHFLKSYTLSNGKTYYPPNTTHEYLLSLIIILGLLTGSFLFTFKTYQSKLWLKTMTIVAILYYLLSILNAQR